VPVVLTAAQVSTLTPPAAITGFATESTLSTLNGKVTAVNTGAVVVSSSALPSGAATESTLSTLNGKVTACNTGAVTISAALPAGTNAVGKLAANDGVDIGDVSINNGSSILPTLVPASSGTGAIQGNSGFSLNMIRLATRTCGSGSTTTSIVSTSHGAVVGNIVQFISGAASPSWSYVSAVPDANTITLAWPLLGAPASGNSFIVGYQVPVSAVGGFTSADTGTATLVAMNTLGGVNSGASNLLKLEDSAHASGDAGVAMFARRKTVPAVSSGTDGDYSTLDVNDSGGLWTTPIANVGGGYSKVKYAAQTTTVQTVKGSAGKLHGYMIYNPNSSVSYVQLFDTASSVTLGTTVPDLILPIPATSGANLSDTIGIGFTTGIKIACTTTETGLTAPSTGLTCSFWYI